MKKSVLYLHGFNSAPGGNKAIRLKEMLPNYDILNPAIDYVKHPQETCDELSKLVTHNKVKLIVGSSMGGFLSFYLTWKHNIPCVVINPCVTPDKTIKEFLGTNKNFVTGEVYEVTNKHLQNYKEFLDNVYNKNVKPNPDLVNMALATDDELLGDTQPYLIKRFPARKILYFDNCGHIFNQFKKLEPLFKEVLKI